MSSAFHTLAGQYDGWFDENRNLFDSEVIAVREMMTQTDKAIEIGVGTGRFAAVLGVKEGVEPSEEMAALARQRGVRVYPGTAEKLPLKTESYDLITMITVDCFLADLPAAFREVARVLTEQGSFVIAFLNRATDLGQVYERMKRSDPFYKEASFHSANEIRAFLQDAGLVVREECQTIFTLEDELQKFKYGTGDGVFTVFRASKVR